MGWCWRSTDESVARGDISASALVETAVAVAGLFLLVKALDSVVPLLIWSGCGWLLLLRSRFSDLVAGRMFQKVFAECDRQVRFAEELEAALKKRGPFVIGEDNAAVGMMAMYNGLRRPPEALPGMSETEAVEGMAALRLTLLAFPIRIYGILVSLRYHFWDSIRSVPDNFIRAVASVDSATPVRLVPGFDAPAAVSGRGRIRELARSSTTRILLGLVNPFGWLKLLGRLIWIVLCLSIGGSYVYAVSTRPQSETWAVIPAILFTAVGCFFSFILARSAAKAAFSEPPLTSLCSSCPALPADDQGHGDHLLPVFVWRISGELDAPSGQIVGDGPVVKV